jgi:Dual specificity phosphatase, catalytic domain
VEDADAFLPWGPSEILPGLFLGDLQDAVKFDGIIINVLHDRPACEPRRAIQLPFLANGRATLDSTAALIDAVLAREQCVLVHCEEGSERAPLVVVWFLITRRAMSLDEAYRQVIAKRPIVRDRRRWLEIFRR